MVNNNNKLMRVLLIASVLVLGANAHGEGGIFDITKYGAKPDGATDMSEALLCAFKDACASPTPATIMIPKGEFLLNQAKMIGPCKAHLTIELCGTIKAPPGPPKLKDDWFTFNHIDGYTLIGAGTLNGRGETVWGKNCPVGTYCKGNPINLRLNSVSNGLVKDITVLNSKQFQVNVIGCKNVTFECVKVIAPANSTNTDGIHIAKSEDIKVINSVIETGDDCISIGDGTVNLLIEKVTCGPGHGISIGSLGGNPGELPVDGVTLRNCTFKNTDNGVRIKTWPDSKEGLVKNIDYSDLIMDNVTNPIVVDQVYCPYNKCNPKVPSKVKLQNITYCNIRGTSSNTEAILIQCSGSCPCDQVTFRDIDITSTCKKGPAQSLCENVKPIVEGKQIPQPCTGKPPAPKKS